MICIRKNLKVTQLGTCLLALILFSNASHAEASDHPADVIKFLADREACDHFRGEIIDPPDEELKRERDANVARYCRRTDARLAKLKRKHANRPPVMKTLRTLDPDIE
jgi:hypothetical protein